MIRKVIAAVCMSISCSAAYGQEVVTGRESAGRSTYMKYCASCHGASAEGQANWQLPNESGELPAPPHTEKGHTWRHSDRDLVKMITDGWRDPFNQTQRLTMPAFKGVLTPSEIKNVVDYLRTLWTPEQQAFQREQGMAEEPNSQPSQVSK